MSSEVQKRVFEWVKLTFGNDYANNVRERVLRFLEEALELAQACDLDIEDVLAMVGYVFNREKGELDREFGGVFTTLHALAAATSTDLWSTGMAELKRCEGRTEEIRAKHRTKPGRLKGH